MVEKNIRPEDAQLQRAVKFCLYSRIVELVERQGGKKGDVGILYLTFICVTCFGAPKSGKLHVHLN